MDKAQELREIVNKVLRGKEYGDYTDEVTLQDILLMLSGVIGVHLSSGVANKLHISTSHKKPIISFDLTRSPEKQDDEVLDKIINLIK